MCLIPVRIRSFFSSSFDLAGSEVRCQSFKYDNSNQTHTRSKRAWNSEGSPDCAIVISDSDNERTGTSRSTGGVRLFVKLVKVLGERDETRSGVCDEVGMDARPLSMCLRGKAASRVRKKGRTCPPIR